MKRYFWTNTELEVLKKYYATSLKSQLLGQLPKRTWQAIRRKAVNLGLDRNEWKSCKIPKLEVTPTLCYLLGVLKGDGSVFINKPSHYTIDLATVDPIFASSFKNALALIGLSCQVSFRDMSKYQNAYGKYRQPIWSIRAYSKVFYRWYQALTFEKIYQFLRRKRNAEAFVRGFYESEGCLSAGQIFIGNKRFEPLLLIKTILRRMRLHPTLYRRKDKLYIMGLFRDREVHAFLKRINPCIKNNIVGVDKHE